MVVSMAFSFIFFLFFKKLINFFFPSSFGLCFVFPFDGVFGLMTHPFLYGVCGQSSSTLPSAYRYSLILFAFLLCIIIISLLFFLKYIFHGSGPLVQLFLFYLFSSWFIASPNNLTFGL